MFFFIFTEIQPFDSDLMNCLMSNLLIVILCIGISGQILGYQGYHEYNSFKLKAFYQSAILVSIANIMPIIVFSFNIFSKPLFVIIIIYFSFDSIMNFYQMNLGYKMYEALEGEPTMMQSKLMEKHIR